MKRVPNASKKSWAPKVQAILILCGVTACSSTPSWEKTAPVLALGWYHSVYIDEWNELYSWGSNVTGQLGLGDLVDRTYPEYIEGNTVWTTVAAGSRHTCAIDSAQDLFCWGVNAEGQLGTGDNEDQVRPTLINHGESSIGWRSVATGGLHSCGLRVDGSLWCWGANPAGQLGIGRELGNQTTPQRVGLNSDWIAVYTKVRFNCAINAAHELFCWGDNSNGQLGQGDTTDRATPMPTAPERRWQSIAPGPLHACGITDAHELFCWGDNTYGQLGIGSYDQARAPVQVGSGTDWATATSGFAHSCATTHTPHLSHTESASHCLIDPTHGDCW